MITLHVEPRKVYSWNEFQEQKPPFSIALDGLVDSQTMRNPHGPYANFDHHTGSDRLATRSTSEQVHIEINLGLFDTFRDKKGISCANVCVNDPDEDTCLAWWLLKNHEQVIEHANPRINRLVYCEDRLDCTAGAYPFGDTHMRRQMAWIFEPYNSERFAGRVSSMGEGEMQNVIEAVERRINEYVFGMCGELALEGHYERIGCGDGWVMTRETGPASRMAMFNDGVIAYIALIAEKQDGSFVYTLGRRSVWTPFDLPRLYACLNAIEKDIVTPHNRWGGSDTVGGSPRETGSKLSPKELQEMINREINQ